MKKKSTDSSAIGELIKKLRASYGSGKKSNETAKKKKNEDDDTALLSQLKKTLDKISATENYEPSDAAKKSLRKPSGKSSKKADPSIEKNDTVAVLALPEEPLEKAIDNDVIEEPIVEEAIEEPILEEVADVQTVNETEQPVEPPLQKKQRAPKRSRVKKESPAPKSKEMMEEPVIEEPIVEEPIVEEPIVEEPIVEELIVEEPIVEEPIVEEPIAEEPIVEEPKRKIVKTVRVKNAAVTMPKSTDAPDFAIKKEPKPTLESAEAPSVKTVLQTPPKKELHSTHVIQVELPSEEKSVSPTAPKQNVQSVRATKATDTQIKIQPKPIESTRDSNAKENDSIVIRPQASRSNSASESIIIRPRVTEYAPPKPTRSDAEAKSDPLTHITIEAMQKKNDNIEAQSTAQDTAPAKSQSFNKTKKIVAAQSTRNDFLLKKDPIAPAIPEAEETTVLVKEDAIASTPTVKSAPAAKTTRKKAAKPRKAMPEAHVEDEALTEVLDDVVEDLIREQGIEEIPADEPEELAQQAEDGKNSIFRRRQLYKQGQAGDTQAVAELVKQRSGFSEDDVAMIFELGYDNELGRLVGYETMKKLRYEHLRRKSHSTHQHYRTAFGYRGEEYMGTKQNEAVLAAYAKDKRSLIRRILLTSLITLLLFFLDMPTLVGASVSSVFLQYPILFQILGILGMVGAALLSWRQIHAGIKSLFRFTPSPYSIEAAILPATLLYALLELLPISVSTIPVCFLTSFSLLLLAIGDAFRLTGEIRTFRVISTKANKTVLETATPRKKKLRQGNKIVKVINDDIGEALYRVRTAEQTTGFFRRVNSMSFAIRPISIFLAIIYTSAFLFGFATVILSASFGYALSAAVTVLLLSCPMSILLTFYCPINRANALLSRRGCALIGQESVADYSDEQTIIFNDTDLYKAEKTAQISIREGDDFRRDLRLSEILFRKMGGTLGRIGNLATKPREPDPSVAFVRIAPAGVEAVVDNQYHVLLGSSDFLRKSGVSVPVESSDMLLSRAANVSVMYVAIDGTLKLSYELKYRTKSDFEDIVTMLAMDGTVIALNSYDPNLTESFLQTSRNGREDPISVVRPGRFEPDALLEVVDTGVVALGRRNDIAIPIHAAKHVKATRNRGILIQGILSFLGVGISITLAALGQFSLLTPISVAAYQLISAAVAILHTHLSLNTHNLYV